MDLNRPLKSSSNGFTLVELLVVISIIAILAGLIFPVFAQAKISAMRTSSLSNLKQIGLGCLMYSADYDDRLPLFSNGNALQLWTVNNGQDTWVWQTQPYIKSLRIFIDPVMGDPHSIFTAETPELRWEQNLYPDYGINYAFLAPWLKDPVSGQCTTAGSVTSSGASHSATTVLLTTTYYPNEDDSGTPTGGYSDYGSWIVTAPAVLSLSAGTGECISPAMDWSEHPAGFNNGRPFTAEASSRYGAGTVNAMLDGHAQYLTLDHLAAGTDWATSSYTHTRIVDPSKYVWDYDGTFAGASLSQ